MAKKSNRSESDLTVAGFGLRFLAALVLVLFTYNPSGYSAYHWITSAISASAFGPLHLLLIGLLLAGWAVFWIATARALNALGVALIGIILGAIVWGLVSIGWISVNTVSSASWVGLILLAIILAVGVSWSHIWRRITGQVNVEHVDD